MSRSRQDIWGDPYQPMDHPPEPQAQITPWLTESEQAETAKIVEEAQDAFSKFMNHNKKREKGGRHSKRGEAWH